MLRVCVIDLLFNWPPDGGARVDTLHLMRYLTERHRCELVIPVFDDAFPRGRIDGDLGFPIRRLSTPASIGSHAEFTELVARHLASNAPDVVILADAWHLKPRLMAELRPWSPIVRFYAHEGLCLKGHGHQYRDGAVCTVDVLADPQARDDHCVPCWRRWRDQTRSRVFDREMRMAEVDRPDYLDDLRRGLRGATAVVVSNQEMVRRLQPHTNRVVQQPMGIDPELFRFRSLPTGRRFLLFGRAYDYLKESHVLLEAGKRLWRKRQDFSIAVTGDPGHRFGVEDPGSLPFVEILEPTPHERVPELIDSCLACVLPPLWPEPFPLAAVEAMGCGRPLIASAVGGLVDLIEPGVNGLLVPPDDPDALADAMRSLLDRPEDVARLSEAARITARDYHWKDLHDRAYGPLLGRANG